MPELPGCLNYDDEHNRKLRKFKQARFSKWKLSTVKSRNDCLTLGAWLFALSRFDESAQLGEWIASETEFKNNYNLWTPVALMIGVACASYRQLRQEASRMSLYSRIAEHPHNVINLILVQGGVDSISKYGQDLAISELGSALASVLYDQEDVLCGRPGTDIYPVDQIREAVQTGVSLLRRGLENKR